MTDTLSTPIAEVRQTERPAYGLTADGYTRKSGAPTSYMIRLEGESHFRRLMVWQFSNAGTAFVRVRGEALIVPEWMLPN